METHSISICGSIFHLFRCFAIFFAAPSENVVTDLTKIKDDKSLSNTGPLSNTGGKL